MLTYIFLLLLSESMKFYVLASIRVLDKGVFPLEKNSIAIIFYIDIENQDRTSTCKLHPWKQKCCLTDSEEDCETMDVYGASIDKVEAKNRKTLLYIYPTICQHDQFGFCDFVLDYQCGARKGGKREHVSIQFDTRCRKNSLYLLKHYISDQKVVNCESLDENSLSNCEPVNCDLKYSGRRPFYYGKAKKCVVAADCKSDLDKVLPNVVYEPLSNTCRDLDHPLTVADVCAINAGLGIVTESTKPKEDAKVIIKSHFLTISQNLKFLRDIMYGKLCPMVKSENSNLNQCSNSAFLSILLYIISITALVLSFACCVPTTLWLHGKWLDGDLAKTFEDMKRKFTKSKAKTFENKESKVNKDVTHKLLKEVIVRNLPLELRDSLVDICERAEADFRMDGRYATGDFGNQVNITEVEEDMSTDMSYTSEIGDNEKLLN